MPKPRIGALWMFARGQREVKCPRCDSEKVYCSSLKTVVDEWLNLVGLRPLRCHRCYFRWRRWVTGKGAPERSWRAVVADLRECWLRVPVPSFGYAQI